MLNRYFKITDDNKEFVYANMAVKNINFALISLDYIFNHSDFEYGIYHDEHTFYFFHIQSILTACGNISNIFYNHTPFNGRLTTERCARLRTSLGINRSKYPLVFQKEIRNTNEHFDERYEDFGGVMGDYNILKQNMDPFMKQVICTNPHLRTYDKDNFIYYTYNRKKQQISFDLKELQKQLLEMLSEIMGNPILESGWEDSATSEQIGFDSLKVK